MAIYLQGIEKPRLSDLVIDADKDWDSYEITTLDRQNYSEINLLSNGDMEVGDPPTGWTATRSTVARESTVIKFGTYSLKITSGTNWAMAERSLADYARYKGRAITIGLWYNVPAANTLVSKVSLYDGVTETLSDAFTKDDAWHFITFTKILSAAATSLRIALYVNASATNDADDILYADGVILVEGDSCPAFSPNPDQKLINHRTASYTLSAYESGHVVHTNFGAGGAITFNIPQVVAAGQVYRFAVMAAQELRIDPGAAGAIYINGAKQVDNKYIWADDEGESIALVTDGNGDLASLYPVGTWGVEA